MIPTNIEAAELTGDGSANTFTVGPWTGSAALEGRGGDDTYVLDDDFGDVTLANSDPGDDTLDFTNVESSHVLTVSADKSTITSDEGTTEVGDDSTLTQGGDKAEEIDVSLLPEYTGVTGKIKDVFNHLSTFIDGIQNGAETIAEILNQLPLLDGARQSLASVLGLSDAFVHLKDEVSTIIGGLGTVNLSEVINGLNGLTVPALFGCDSCDVSFATDYRGEPGTASTKERLEALIDVDLSGKAIKTVDVNLGADAELLGIEIDGSITATATLTGDLTFGLTTTGADSPTVFVVSRRDIRPNSPCLGHIGWNKRQRGLPRAENHDGKHCLR